MNATEACIALNMLPTVGPVRLRKLLEVFNEPQQILAANVVSFVRSKELVTKLRTRFQTGNRLSILPAS